MRRPTVGAAVPAARTGLAVENVEIVEKKLRGATKGYANATPWAPQVPLRNTGEQVFRIDRFAVWGRGGRQGTATPTMGLGASVGRCGPQGTAAPTTKRVAWGRACEASGETLVEPLSPVGVC